jgi:pSer/pThr/pTyr-binding forkhead associated (FHA) protein
MNPGLNAQLVPVGGGDPIPLIRPLLTVGRRESCDVCMRFPNISGLHCELSCRDGYWFIRDLNSTNGVKVNGTRVHEKVILPTDEVTIGKRKYTIEYTLPRDRRAPEEDVNEVVGQSLLEKAGLEKGQKGGPRKSQPHNPLDMANRLGRAADKDDDDDD